MRGMKATNMKVPATFISCSLRTPGAIVHNKLAIAQSNRTMGAAP